MLPEVIIDTDRAYPPRLTAFTRPFWNGLAQRRFLTTCCAACGKFSFPPKPFCPHCWHREITWQDLSGHGILYAATVIHAAPTVFKTESPYRVCIVDLAEGIRLATRLISAAPVALDTQVQLVVLRYRDGRLFAAQPLP
jgi:uncharacterized OB-fold protein